MILRLRGQGAFLLPGWLRAFLVALVGSLQGTSGSVQKNLNINGIKKKKPGWFLKVCQWECELARKLVALTYLLLMYSSTIPCVHSVS